MEGNFPKLLHNLILNPGQTECWKEVLKRKTAVNLVGRKVACARSTPALKQVVTKLEFVFVLPHFQHQHRISFHGTTLEYLMNSHFFSTLRVLTTWQRRHLQTYQIPIQYECIVPIRDDCCEMSWLNSCIPFQGL